MKKSKKQNYHPVKEKMVSLVLWSKPSAEGVVEWVIKDTVE